MDDLHVPPLRRSVPLQAVIGLLRIMRPKQWTKNGLIFAALVFDGQLFDRDPFLRVLVGFILLCLISSTVYIVNDLVDIESDRQHPRKKNRPLPSGQLPFPLAVAAVVVLPLITLGTALFLLNSPKLALILVAYLILHILYSFALKRIVLIDILTITSGYVLRVAAGVVLIEVANFSPWLYACTALLALFLAVGKRRQELLLLAENAGNVRLTFQEYNLPLLDDLLRIATNSTLIAYILYTIEAPTGKVAGINLALITVPFVMYALFRYLYLIHVKGEGSDPEEVLLHDHPLQLAILCWGLVFVFILYQAT